MMMKKIKKVFIALNFLFLMLPIFKVSVKAGEVPILRADGNGYVTYSGTSIQVTIPDTYELPETSFRAVWVSPLVSDITTFSTEAQYKNEITEVLDVLDYYNINAMIFHVRIYNDALYESKYNKWSSYYNTNPSWDALPWIIEECHKRGIEFHAWMNPYRVASSSKSIDEVVKKFNSNNPASSTKNLLKGKDTIILNPGLPNVRTFLVNTCMELIENYDVDAIHFDDYFYADGIDDSDTYEKYNYDNLSLEDWRREQINIFIKSLSEKMRAYNQKTGRRVQLGISPSGIWKSAGTSSYVKYDENGNAITNGSSTTSTFEHYGGYLFADTLKWINEEWIDYILPQTYWAIEHSSAAYTNLVKWWAEVVKYKKVNLYVSLGLYKRNESGGSSWETNDLEGYNQIMYGSNYDTVKGYSVYKYSFLKASSKGSDKGFKKVNELWSKPAILPEIRTMDKIIIDNPTNLTVGKTDSGYRIQFDEVSNTKFYVIYRSSKELTYSPDEVIDIIGNTAYDGKVNYTDLIDNNDNYYYGVKAQSYSLTLTDGISVSTNGSGQIDKAPIEKVEDIIIASNLIVNTTLEIKWKKIFQNIGNEVEYELYYSTDNEVWIKSENDIKLDSTGYFSTNLKIADDKKLYLKVKAYNNYGESMSEVKMFNISEQLQSINHFCIIGNTYSGCNVEFVWNNLLDYPDIKYTIQISYDGMKYEDVKAIETNKNVNIRVDYTLPEETGKVYYRIKGETDGCIAYSTEQEITIETNLGDAIEFEIDFEKPKDYYILNEGEILEITFSKNEKNTYISKLSSDGINWLVAKNYNSKNSIEENNKSVKQLIYMPDLEYKMYYYLEVMNNGSVNESNVIEIYIIPEVVFYDELISFMEKEQNNILTKTNMFN